MANVSNNISTQDTRSRLLWAAGEVFAEKGPHAATIREITRRAGANIAAVNYHFRDKTELYAEVIRRIEADAAAIIPPNDRRAGDAEERFRQCVRHLALAMLGRGQPPWERVLLARELAWPSPAMNSLLDNVGGALNQVMAEVIGELTGRRPSAAVVGHLIASIMGQCVYHLQHQSQLRRLYPQFKRSPSADAIAEHIVRFSLAGVLAYSRSASRPPSRVARPRRRIQE